MKAWLWNNEFSAVASDMVSTILLIVKFKMTKVFARLQPAFESWPVPEGVSTLHETVIANFGMPIGEFFDCELLSKICKEKNRYTFFFVSNPLFILGGCASTANASAIF